MITFLRILLLWFICATAAAAQTCPVRILDVQAAPASADDGKPDEQAWETVTLPNNWSLDHPTAHGSIWYRVDWQADCTPTTDLALLLPSIIMAGEVFINDHFLWADTHLSEPLSRSWNMPRYWHIPGAWLNEDGKNTL